MWFALLTILVALLVASLLAPRQEYGHGDSAELRAALAACASGNGDADTGSDPATRLRTLWLVRHTRSEQNSGQTSFKSESYLERMRGLWAMVTGFDAPPSGNGWKMLRARAARLAPQLAGAGIELAFYSPLVRAAATHQA